MYILRIAVSYVSNICEFVTFLTISTLEKSSRFEIKEIFKINCKSSVLFCLIFSLANMLEERLEDKEDCNDILLPSFRLKKNPKKSQTSRCYCP